MVQESYGLKSYSLVDYIKHRSFLIISVFNIDNIHDNRMIKVVIVFQLELKAIGSLAIFLVLRIELIQLLNHLDIDFNPCIGEKRIETINIRMFISIIDLLEFSFRKMATSNCFFLTIKKYL
jgi:hypothetical protein